jgi:hypothetical protein
MSEFLDSLKTDLLDRRLLPILALVGVALVAAVAYAVLGGGGSAASPSGPTAASSTAPAATKVGSIAVTPASPSSVQPVAETTDGVSHQHGGASRNPFSPLPGAKTASASTTGATSDSSGSSSSGAPSPSSAPTKGSGGTSTPAPTTPTKPVAPAKPQTVYQVAVLFGVAPAPTSPPSSSQLTPYGNLKRLQPLPSATAPLVVFRGVTAGGGSATFTLVGEAILHGNAACLPSASQCQAIDLKPGLVEELEYLPPSGQAIVYQLKVVSITAVKASAAKAASLFHAESKAGRELLRRDGLAELPWLRYAADRGVLVFAGHPAFAARAHAAGRRSHR